MISKKLLTGALARISQALISISIGFVMMPFFMENLGSFQYSLWILVGSITSAYYILDLGMSNVLTRFLVRDLKNKDWASANTYISNALVIYSGLAIFLFLLTMMLAHSAPDFRMFSAYNQEDVSFVILLIGFSLAIEFPSKAFAGIVSAHERFDVIAISRSLFLIATAVTNFIVLSKGGGVSEMAIIVASFSVLSTGVFVVIAFRLQKNLVINVNKIDKNVLFELYTFSKWTFLTDVFITLRNRIDIWSVSFFLSPIAVTIYYVSSRLVEYSVTFIQQITGILVPTLSQSHYDNDNESLQKKVQVFYFVICSFVTLIIVGLALVGESFILIWMGDEFDYHSAYSCMLILLMGKMMKYMFEPLSSTIFSIGKPKIITMLSAIEVVLTGVLVVSLAPSYGLLGIATAASVPFFITRLLMLPQILKREVGSKIIVIYAYLAFHFILIIALIGFGKILMDGQLVGSLKEVIMISLIIMVTFFIPVILLNWTRFLSIKSIMKPLKP